MTLAWSEVSLAEVAGILAGAERYSVQPASHSTAGCRYFAVLADGEPVLAMAARMIGAECVIIAAAGRYPIDLTALGLDLMESEARAWGAETLAFQTRRRGLVKKAGRLGYGVRGYIMRKEI